MKILSMTATFGKLEHETLRLQPGLNIIEAPNEWGKSTWCAFVVAMLYGIDTRAKTTKTTLADKERYAPWSGAPMEGRMEILWNGRSITLERRTRGRLIFGDFRAYETETGMDVPELTAANCGLTLLGVERSVFVRAGFLKLSDLPLTQDDSLRRRLNNLVTTGDENSAGDTLGKQLKELKNKCRFNRTGLIPQAEAQYARLEDQLRSLQALNSQAQRLENRQKELETWVAQLENHKKALAYAAAQADAVQVEQALRTQDAAQEQVAVLEQAAQALPPETEAARSLKQARALQQAQLSLQMEEQMSPPAPQAPDAPEMFRGMTPEASLTAAQADGAQLRALAQKKKRMTLLAVFGGVLLALGLLAAAAVWAVLASPAAAGGLAAAVLGLVCLAAGVIGRGGAEKAQRALAERYGSQTASDWLDCAQAYAARQQAYAQALSDHEALCAQRRQQMAALQAEIDDLTQGRALDTCVAQWEQVQQTWSALGDARRDLQQAAAHAKALQSMAKAAQPPEFADTLTQSASETDALLASAAYEQKQNQLRLGQYQGQAEALGQESAILTEMKQTKARIDRLEDTYLALELAQKALSAATSELQRRFAPKISKRAQALFSRLTGGRYQRITFGEDLSLSACTQDEDTLRASQWRSDGTVDQLYLALRLAVAEELTPDAPLILDDVLARFDDARLSAALDILRQEAQTTQVILFTCQTRENEALRRLP